MKPIRIAYGSVVNELKDVVTVVHGDYPDCKRAMACKAIWDTGASDTAVDSNVIKTLGLRRADRPPRITNTGNGRVLSYAYHALIELSKDMPPLRMVVYEMPPSDVWVLIGMDIICHGRFTVDSTSGETVLTFEPDF